jgi:hypothetical protein
MSSKTLECQLTVMLQLLPQLEGVDHSDSRKSLAALPLHSFARAASETGAASMNRAATF